MVDSLGYDKHCWIVFLAKYPFACVSTDKILPTHCESTARSSIPLKVSHMVKINYIYEVWVFLNRYVLEEPSREREQTQLYKRMFEFREFQLVAVVT